MTDQLVARFEKQFAGGPTIAADLTAPADRFSITVLFGPSGCGKTTILRCLAGLEHPDSGSIRLCERVWFDAAQRICLSPQQRDIGFLFQEYALFPHLTVADNVGYSLTNVAAGERRQRIDEMLQRFELAGLGERYPRQISGGQQQRVALARALVRRPRLLLLDEPLSSLDSALRDQLRTELRRLLADFAIPVVLVTHDRLEAMSLADQVVVLHQGRVRQAGPVADVFGRPADQTVAQIVGVESVVSGRVVNVADGLATVRVGNVELLAVSPSSSAMEVLVCIRAEAVVLELERSSCSGRNQLAGRVLRLTPEGPLVRVELDCGFRLAAVVTRSSSEELGLAEGSMVTAVIKASAIHLISKSDEPKTSLADFPPP